MWEGSAIEIIYIAYYLFFFFTFYRNRGPQADNLHNRQELFDN